MIPIIDGVIRLGQTWLEGKQKKSAAKSEREASLLRDTSNWEAQQANASANSWKDEYWTVVLSLPVVLAFFGVPLCVFFFPDKLNMLHEAIQKQFEMLNGLPEWYTWALGASIGASFGFKGFKQIRAGKVVKGTKNGNA